MKNTTLKLIATAGILSTLLTSCDHQHGNKLLTANKDLAGRFIYQAEMYALTKTGYNYFGTPYANCVRNPHHYDNPLTGQTGQCQKILQTMLAYSQRSKAFNGLSMANLNNLKVVNRLSDIVNDYRAASGQVAQAHQLEKQDQGRG